MHARITLLSIVSGLGHMEDRWSLGRIIDNVVIDVIVVDNVGHIATARGHRLPLNSLLLGWDVHVLPLPSRATPNASATLAV